MRRSLMLVIAKDFQDFADWLIANNQSSNNYIFISHHLDLYWRFPRGRKVLGVGNYKQSIHFKAIDMVIEKCSYKLVTMDDPEIKAWVAERQNGMNLPSVPASSLYDPELTHRIRGDGQHRATGAVIQLTKSQRRF